jgi:ElaB/YqjD/DUF883 family membrane-anchored ribosome-binding protein
MPATVKTEMNRAAQDLKSAIGADPSAADVMAQLDTLRQDMAQLVETMASLGRAKANDAAHSLTDTAHDLRRRGEENLVATRQKGAEALDQAADFVRRRPTEAVAVAGAIGVLLGLFLNRR